MQHRENYYANGCYMFILKLKLVLHISMSFICGFIDLVYLLYILGIFFSIYFTLFTVRFFY